MRVAVSAESNLGLEADVSSHFGHSPHFVLVDLDGKQIKSVLTVANPAYPGHIPGGMAPTGRSGTWLAPLCGAGQSHAF
jgi:predicted Fe-Mo cluster-binding NifX family protein